MEIKKHHIYIALGVILLGIGAAMGINSVLQTPPSDPAATTITVTTQNLPTLLPHFHGTGDKVTDPHHSAEVFADPVTVPDDFWVTDVSITIQNAPPEVIHHLFLLKLDDRGYENPLAETMVVQGQDNDFTELHFPAPTAILIRKGTRIGIDAFLHDALPPEGEGGTYKDVTVTATLTGVASGHGRSVPVTFGLLRLSDETSPAYTSRNVDASFSIPPHSLGYVRTNAMNAPTFPVGSVTFNTDGWILRMAAHMHAWQGGKEVDALLNGKPVVEYRSTLANAQVPWSWRTKFEPLYLRIHKGDVLTLSATYDNPSDASVAGAMALLGYFFVSDASFTETNTALTRDWTLKSLAYPVLDSLGIHPKQ